MTLLDLRTDYLGITLRSPVLVGPSPLSFEPEQIKQFSIAGAGAVVVPHRLGGEQVVFDRYGSGSVSSGDVLEGQSKNQGFCLETIKRLKSVTGIPILVSLSGAMNGSLLDAASAFEDVGASAIEWNVNYAISNGEATAAEIEDSLVSSVEELCGELSIPVSVSLLPYHTNLSNLSNRLAGVGARGIVCFGREPTWEVRRDRILQTAMWSPRPEGFVNRTVSGIIRAASGRPGLSLAAFGGISSTEDVIAALLAGADVVCMVSEIYRSGPDTITHILEGLDAYLERSEFHCFDDLRAWVACQRQMRNPLNAAART